MSREFDWDGFWRPWLITLVSGLATTIGAALVFFIDPKDEKKLSTFLALSGGVMLFLCFSEMLPESLEKLEEHYEKEEGKEKKAEMLKNGCFFSAILMCVLFDYLTRRVVEFRRKKKVEGHSGCTDDVEEQCITTAQSSPAQEDRKLRDFRLMSLALMAAAAVTVHNFPEGMSTFYSNVGDKPFGLAMAVAMGIHNIPEGVAVGLPILKASGSRLKAFSVATMSGFAQPVAALVGYLALGSNLSPITEGILYAVISGVMVYIAIASLYPVALEYNASRGSAFFLLGMGSMGLASTLIGK